MGDAAQAPAEIISLPEGGGALRGIGETFAPDLQTGTGNFTVPIAVPPGRHGLEPELRLAYSTGNGNGIVGLGWLLAVPSIARKTARGIPIYDDARDTFLLAAGEDLVRVGTLSATQTAFRPRTEGSFDRIVHHRAPADGQDYWEVTDRGGRVSRYGSVRPAGAPDAWRDPAALLDPGADRPRIFSWHLTETRDLLGNRIVYEYAADAGEGDGHHWRQPLLRTIRYANYTAQDGTERFLATVTFADEEREDAFSSYTAGFEIRTSRRYASITTALHPGSTQRVRRYELDYDRDPHNGVSLLASVAIVGFDEAGAEHRDLPPLALRYRSFAPASRRFAPVTGPDPPAVALSQEDHELVDLTGDGLPDVLQLNGVARYWRNRGDGTFDRPRPMDRAPAGVQLGDPDVRLLDADGDGRADLLVRVPGGPTGYFPLRFGPSWGTFRPYAAAPGFSLGDARVQLLDLDGDGTTDALYAGAGLQCFFSQAETGWSTARPARIAGAPALDFADPRLHWADMTGDGQRDIVLVHDRSVAYWPNLGHGRFGDRVAMLGGPRLAVGADPRALLLGDLDGDGLADLVLPDGDGVTVWFNRSGNGWSDAVRVAGLPSADWDLRITDLLGTGTAGLLWSRDATSASRPSMYFLDLTGGVKPRLLTEVDNDIGALTRIAYAPSTVYSRADDARRATRWRTTLPFVVPVVARVEAIDRVSGRKLTTTYRYRHGYWDRVEREFRGFGRVEQTDTETFADYHDGGLHPGTSFAAVDVTAFSPPTLTRTWFHLGPVGAEEAGHWEELDLRDEHWPGDAALLGHADATRAFLAGLPDRSARRDALRALRGRPLRSELFALDATERADRPYTVTEHAYGLRQEAAAAGAPRVFSAFETAQRTTEWERGCDPMTRFEYLGDHDAVGQARRRTLVAPARRSERRTTLTAAGHGAVVPDPAAVLARHERTSYATPAAGTFVRDRVAELRSYALRAPPQVAEQDPGDVQAVLADQARMAAAVRATFDALAPTDVELLAHVVNHFDGAAFQGLAAGALGAHGLLTRTEALAFTDAQLADAYGAWRPAYLGGAAALPAGAPAGFGQALGYRQTAAGNGYAAGWYADTLCQAHDVQLSTNAAPLPERGVVLRARDPLGRETEVEPDAYWLLPVATRDAAGLKTTAQYDYRAGRPRLVVDPNGDATHYRYHPLGLVAAVFVEPGDAAPGGTEAGPELAYTYDFQAFARDGRPISTHTTQRVWHAEAGISDETIELREYTDGFGRVLQRRTQADDLAFGEDGDDAGVLVTGADGVPRPVPGQVAGPAVGVRSADRVVVSGWEVQDNKGRVVETYEPFLSTGWDYEPEADARRGRRVQTFYDARGQVVRVLNPDGSQRRTVFGVPDDLTKPGTVEPTPWTVTAYDENDLAAASTAPGAAAVPVAHRSTPSTTVVDGLGRAVCQLARGGPVAATDWIMTRTAYDIRGNLRAIVDQLGRTAFAHAYDHLDRRLRTDGLDAGRMITVPDAAGAPVHDRDTRGCVVLRTFDALSRVAGVYARDRPDQPLTLRQRVEYGDSGDPAQPAAARAAARAARRLGRVWRHYDEAGLVVVGAYTVTGATAEWSRRTVSDAAIAAAEPDGWTADWAAVGADADLEAAAHTTTTRYDALGRAVEVVVPGGQLLAATFAPSGALRSVSVDGTPYVRLFAHNARGQRVLVAYGDGTAAGAGAGPVTRFAYDPDSFRLTRLRTERMTPGGDTWSGGGAPLQDLTYGTDLLGNVVAVEERTTGCGVAGTPEGRDRLLRSFGYDAFSRLTSATGRACADIGHPRPRGDTPRCGRAPAAVNAPDVTETYRETFRYDPAGNLVELGYRTTTGAAAASWHRSFGLSGNRLTSLDDDSGAAPLQYDDAGNLTSEDTTRTYEWDHAGRLRAFRVQAGAGTSVVARYLYGSDGRRVKKWVRRGGTSALDESITYVGDAAEHHRWSKGGGGTCDLLAVLDGDRRLAEIRTGDAHPDDTGPAIRFVLSDHVGSAATTLDAAGTWLSREEYFPYGETSFGSFSRKRYRYIGRERDEESGLSYHEARYYHPALCRWTRPDPIGAAGGLNPYAYAAGSPIVLRDPGGDQPARAENAPQGTVESTRATLMRQAAFKAGAAIDEQKERWQYQYETAGVYPLYGTKSDYADATEKEAARTLREAAKGEVAQLPAPTDCIMYQRFGLRQYWDALAGDPKGLALAREFRDKVDLGTLEPKNGTLGVQGRGMGIIAAAAEMSFDVIYYNRDGKADQEYKDVRKLGYVSPKGAASVPRLGGGRVSVRAQVDSMVSGASARERKAMFERLKAVPFAIGAADFGHHTFLIVNGRVSEAHWSAEPVGRAPNVLEDTDIEKFFKDYTSVVIAVPPGF